jgi:rapamycin-insensitive companion of mTOR
MAEKNDVLSLRGTCLYILNMICTTSTGRKELERFSWISYRNSNLGIEFLTKVKVGFAFQKQSTSSSSFGFKVMKEIRAIGHSKMRYILYLPIDLG